MAKKYFGKTRLETILVMIMLIVFGISTYTLVVAAASSYNKNHNDTVAKDNLRLAISYIETKIKQGDINSVSVSKDAITGKNYIAIEEDVDGEDYENIIYFQDGSLKEMIVKKGTNLNEVEGFEIAKIKNLEIEKINENLINITVFTDNQNGKDYKSNTIINLKL